MLMGCPRSDGCERLKRQGCYHIHTHLASRSLARIPTLQLLLQRSLRPRTFLIVKKGRLVSVSCRVCSESRPTGRPDKYSAVSSSTYIGEAHQYHPDPIAFTASLGPYT